ncbi:hypothetical protein HZA75_03280 [Candidatus Roizmanbacteria bacterium]|nr:hypothetical protein [Candidatus Roizmanbacteria bacterium]
MRQRQKDLIIGKLLGDGNLENRGTANSRLQIRHSLKQKEYVDWCYKQLKEFTKSNPKQHKDAYYFRTKSLPIFTKLRKLWYIDGKKVLPSNLNLSPFIISIWYMDDGYFDRVNKSIWLCTHCYSNKEIKLLLEMLNKFNIYGSKIKDRKHFKIRVFSRDTKKFIRLVKPYIIPSLLYKIEDTP